jgi:hypothetical protein
MQLKQEKQNDGCDKITVFDSENNLIMQSVFEWFIKKNGVYSLTSL